VPEPFLAAAGMDACRAVVPMQATFGVAPLGDPGGTDGRLGLGHASHPPQGFKTTLIAPSSFFWNIE
jgi:hypothetical protein